MLSVTEVDVHDRTTEITGACNLQAEVGYITALVLVNAGALCCALFQAWQARNLSTEFAESHYIFKALASILSLMFVGVPVLIIASDNADARLFVSSAINFSFAVAILLLMFVPKIQYEKREKAKSVRNLTVSGMSGMTPASYVSQVSQLESDDETSTSNLGEKIITTKTAEELALEVSRLQRRLLATQKRVDALSSARPRSVVNSEDSLMEDPKQKKCTSTVAFSADSVEPLLEQNPGDVDKVETDSPLSSASFSTNKGGEAPNTQLVDSSTTASTQGVVSVEGGETDATADLESSKQRTCSSPTPQPTESRSAFQRLSPKVNVLKLRQEAAAHKLASIQQAMSNRQSDDAAEEQGGSDALL